MIERSQISGLILAGGRATRMQGIDKGLAPLAQQPLIEYVIARLQPQVHTLVISANRNIDRYASYGWPVISDQDAQSFQGPLSGFLAGLQVCQTPYLVVVPCDSPYLPTDIVQTLVQAFIQNPHADLAYAQTCESQRVQKQPVFCLMKQTLLGSLQGYLARGLRKIDGWFAEHHALAVDFEDAHGFVNINTLPELDPS